MQHLRWSIVRVTRTPGKRWYDPGPIGPIGSLKINVTCIVTNKYNFIYIYLILPV